MIQNQTDAKLGFYHLAESWYAPHHVADYTDEIEFGLYYADGSCKGADAAIRWYPVGGKSVPKLEMFSDSWTLLRELAFVFTLLAEIDPNTCAEEFCGMLLNRGFGDLTQRERE